MGGSSKSNEGQAKLVTHIISLLQTARAEVEADDFEILGVTVLSPYTKQVKLLRSTIPSKWDVSAYTIDSFQGREDDVIIFTTVRSNASQDIGFVEDERRLSVDRSL